MLHDGITICTDQEGEMSEDNGGALVWVMAIALLVVIVGCVLMGLGQ